MLNIWIRHKMLSLGREAGHFATITAIWTRTRNSGMTGTDARSVGDTQISQQIVLHLYNRMSDRLSIDKVPVLEILNILKIRARQVIIAPFENRSISYEGNQFIPGCRYVKWDISKAIIIGGTMEGKNKARTGTCSLICNSMSQWMWQVLLTFISMILDKTVTQVSSFFTMYHRYSRLAWNSLLLGSTSPPSPLFPYAKGSEACSRGW